MIKSNNSIKRISLIYIISLIPLIIYGFYKNGIYLYMKKYVGIFGLLKPIIFLLIGAIIGISVNIIYDYFIKKNKKNIIDSIFSSFHLIYGILISCVVSINTNIIVFSLITFIVLLISKFIKNNRFNIVCVAVLLIFLVMNIFKDFSFLNIYELNNKFKLDTIDYLFGRGSGGIFTTNIIFLIIGFIILYLSKTYKKNIALFSMITFLIISIIYCICINNIGNILNMLFTNGIMFSFIYIATDSPSSSYTNIGSIIYGILVGILTFLLYLINPYLSSFGAIFIVSILNSLIDLKFE